MKISGSQKGCAPGLKPRGSSAGRGTGDLGTTVPPLKGCKSTLTRRGMQPPPGTGKHHQLYFSKTQPHFPPKPTFFSKEHPSRCQAPTCLCTNSLTPPPRCDPLAGRYYRYREITDYLEEKRADDTEILLSVSVTLQKGVSPKERAKETGPAVTWGTLCNARDAQLV